MKKIILTLSLLFPIFAIAQQEEGIKFEEKTTLKKLLSKAESENKIIFIDAYTSWCAPCMLMAKNIFPQKTVGDYYNANFVNAKIDMEKGDGPDIAKKYNINAFPTYLFIDKNGEVLHRGVSYMDVETFINLGKNALNPAKHLGTLKKRFEKGDKDNELLLDIMNVTLYAEPELAEKVANIYYAEKKDSFSKTDLQTLFGFIKSQESPFFKIFKDRKNDIVPTALTESEYKAAFGTLVSNFAAQNSLYADGANGLNEAIFIEEASKSVTKQEAENLLQSFKLNMLLSQGDFKEYEKLALAFYKDGKGFSAYELNKAAWVFCKSAKSQSSLKSALAWALESVKIEPEYTNNDTTANLYAKLGDKANAITYAKKAIDLAKEKGEDTSEMQTLLNSLK